MLIAGATALIILAVFSGPAMAERYAETPYGYGTVAERCAVCHSLEKGGGFRVAPNLWDIVGADKARDRSWYNYSPALIRMGGTWTEEELDRFLADASAFAPGSTKSIRVSDSAEREEIIAYLRKLTD
jgi:cytochrome c